MDEIRKHKIAESFPTSFAQAELGITISKTEFNVFEVGIYSYSMDDKWNVFVIDKILFLARSWTDHCIYKVFTEPANDEIVLKNFQVSRDPSQYKATTIEDDVIILKQLLQMYLGREDFYSDPELELKLIKQTIEKEDKHNNYTKSVGSKTVGTTRQLYQALIANSHGFYRVTGWKKLEKQLSNKLDDEPLMSLHLGGKQTHFSKTFYFNQYATELLGQVIIVYSPKWIKLGL